MTNVQTLILFTGAWTKTVNTLGEFEIELSLLIPSPLNNYPIGDITPLMGSIKSCGLITPLSVIGPANDGTYTILAGERRITAIRNLIDSGDYSLDSLPCYVLGPITMPEIEQKLIIESSNLESRDEADYNKNEHRMNIIRLLKKMADDGSIKHSQIVERAGYDDLSVKEGKSDEERDQRQTVGQETNFRNSYPGYDMVGPSDGKMTVLMEERESEPGTVEDSNKTVPETQVETRMERPQKPAFNRQKVLDALGIGTEFEDQLLDMDYYEGTDSYIHFRVIIRYKAKTCGAMGSTYKIFTLAYSVINFLSNFSVKLDLI